MKRTIALLGVAAFFLSVAAYTAEDHGGGGNQGGGNSHAGGGSHVGGAVHSMGSAGHSSMGRVGHSAPAHQPMVIRMNHSSGASNYHAGYQPSYGQTQWNRPVQNSAQPVQRPTTRVQATRQFQTPHVSGTRLANVVHHHAYAAGYVRQKLSKIGVKTEPRYITDRSEIVSTDRAHSMIGNPSTGPKGEPFKASMVSPRQFNNSVVRGQMAIASRPDFMRQIDHENVNETERNHVYWHTGTGFNYAHYTDNSGYNWYGWDTGGQFFWTRNDGGRWWWYDPGYNRWCFYNDNYWWWQDPYHVGDLYFYNDDGYIAANSADDQIVVSGAEQSGDAVYNSPDGSRTVKITPNDGDTFLYDTANPPTFDPVYLASGVQSVQFSNTGDQRPLEIILKLNDGSYDMFDADGNPYNSGSSEAD
jgi:hypothetical protein